jgi:hypothetical protein
MADQTFTSGQILTAAQMTTLQSDIGMISITPTGATNATLSGAVATIGAGVSSFTISGCFTSSFTNYRVILSGIAASADQADFRLTFNNSAGTTYATVGVNMDYNSATQYPIGPVNRTYLVVGGSSTTSNNCTFDVFMPYAAAQTFVNSTFNGTNHVMWYNSRDTNAASQTGFTITAASGTFSGGTVRVQAYR